MTTPLVPRDELIERCRRQRARLGGMTGAAMQRVHSLAVEEFLHAA